MNAIFYALYLPNKDKIYTIEHFFNEVKLSHKKCDVYIGIQGNSIKDTERIISRLGKGLRLYYGRVRTSMVIDSDASSFIRALELYKENKSPIYDFCYFAHSKGVTSGNDQIRKHLFEELFRANLASIFSDDNIGSYGPYITVTNVKEDINKMRSMKLFSNNLVYDVMHYYYIHTFFVLRGKILKDFIDSSDDTLFKTNIIRYSDRYLFERDFFHIADMLGYLPSYKYLHGNYSTNYSTPSELDVMNKVSLYLKSKEEYERLYKYSNNNEE